ncbi:MAG: hypothetical protein FD138_3565 [Planctomycetota bacterium]|nr:MAG: hypothetical protein FD138_3565 [Planctomycetota bacterium]
MPDSPIRLPGFEGLSEVVRQLSVIEEKRPCGTSITKTSTNSKPLASSISGYLPGMLRLQKRQRPLSHSQPRIGTLSFAGSCVPQRSQYDESGLISDFHAAKVLSCFGKRCTQTVRKLPSTAPYRNKKTTMKAGGRSYGITECLPPHRLRR